MYDERIEMWLDKIEQGRGARKKFEPMWEAYYREVFGEAWKQRDYESDIYVDDEERRRYRFDLLLSFLRTEIPNLVYTIPEAYLTPTPEAEVNRPDALEATKRAERFVNAVVAEIDGLDAEIEAILADAHIALGVAKIVAKPRTAENPKAGQLVVDEILGQPVRDMETGEVITEPDEVLDGMDFDVYRVDPFNFLIDPNAKNSPNRAMWIGEEITMTLEELKASGLYDEKVISKIEKARKSKGVERDKEDHEIDVKIYEIYDLANNRVLVLSDEIDDGILRDDPTPEGIDGHPYAILKFSEVPGQFYPVPEVKSGISQQRDYNQSRQWQKEWAEKIRPKLRVDPTKFEDEDEIDKVTDGISDYYMARDGAVAPGIPDIRETTAQEQHAVTCLRDFDQAMGQSSVSRGELGQSKFAAEVEAAELKGKARESKKAMKVQMFMRTIIEKILLLADAYLDISDMNLDVDIEIDIENKTPKNRAIERKQLNEALTMIASNPLYMQSPTLLKAIFRLYDIKQADAIIQELTQMASQSSQSEQKPSAPSARVNVSFQPKWELLTEDQQNAILDLAFQADIPPVQGGNGQGQAVQNPLAPSASPAAGTEGLEPGNGMMPSGEVL